MDHKLRAQALERLQQETVRNTAYVEIVSEILRASDRLAQRLPLSDRADYEALKTFFSRLAFHSGLGRYYSWVDAERKSYFTFPLPRANQEKLYLELIIMGIQQDPGLAEALRASQSLCTWNGGYAKCYQVQTSTQLNFVLTALNRFHNGHVLPASLAAWRERHPQPCRIDPVLPGLMSLDQPDCWM